MLENPGLSAGISVFNTYSACLMPHDVDEILPAYDVVLCKERGLSYGERLEFGIPQLGVSMRVANKLEGIGVLWVESLRGITRERIRSLGNFGPKMMTDLDNGLRRVGVRLEENGTLTDLFENGKT